MCMYTRFDVASASVVVIRLRVLLQITKIETESTIREEIKEIEEIIASIQITK